MNKNTIQQIFGNYIAEFDLINDEENDENFKWYAAYDFPALMDKALEKNGTSFATALSKVKKCTGNLIDGKTLQPFAALVALAKKEPDTVKQMFVDLYEDDGGDFHVRETLIQNFITAANELAAKYELDPFTRKQDIQSVSAYLFFKDPEHHYLFRPEQSQNFALYIEFNEDWGKGDHIKLDIYYKMCDWIVDQITSDSDLLAVDAGRFADGDAAKMYDDPAKHLLCYDIIRCADVYDLCDDIPLKAKQKQGAAEPLTYREKCKDAADLYDKYKKARAEYTELKDALFSLESVIKPGTKITHAKFGAGDVTACSDGMMTVAFADGSERKFKTSVVFGSGFATLKKKKDQAAVAELAPILGRWREIENTESSLMRKLDEVREYLK